MEDVRRQQAESWGADQLGWPEDFVSDAIGSDASFRRYFRLSHEGRTVVVMDAPPEIEKLDAFIDIGQRLERAGLHVPDQLHVNHEQGFLLLEDLGQRPYHLVLNADTAATLFDDALGALITMQTYADPRGLPEYDPAMLLREVSLFPDWFLNRHWQVEPTDEELDAWDSICATLVRWALDQPRVFCHRDYMPRNLMLADPNPGIIDFQGAVLGPISYDPVCLFRDAFLSWPQEQVDTWLENYRQRARAAGLPVPESAGLWRRTCDFMAVQRHLKVIGIFARIHYRDGKSGYLEDTPRFFAYLEQAIERNPELLELGRLIAAWQHRRQLD
ncbi:phosphotransferase [Wenzhouxiangella sp. AB-CW3]|uniref:aminoglycoside phosphotransferase family protein n=1 Tax=Wenzhouxiangella sp. AB-CW3 TaxID=2771012 RepID=UPI00168C04E5|nr:phosphotransferase [Wenzhouxiangella sp. AB-CW3]QOC21711.1 phosphotransferase [Wenzhouxiangella sp. AB-CW3]